MSYQLVIAEKPSVARSIAGVIGATEKHDGYLQGNGYLVSWCIGHLVSFADAGRYDERFKKWRNEDLPILPEKWQRRSAAGCQRHRQPEPLPQQNHPFRRCPPEGRGFGRETADV